MYVKLIFVSRNVDTISDVYWEVDMSCGRVSIMKSIIYFGIILGGQCVELCINFLNDILWGKIFEEIWVWICISLKMK